MSKYVKQLVSDEVRKRLTGVKDALLVNMVGLTANQNNRVRAMLADNGVRVLVVKNSLARRACEGTPLEAMFEGVDGTNAVCWGSEDIVGLAKVVVKLQKDDAFPEFKACGGVLDGEQLSPEQVVEVSKWPTREEQISLLVGQIVGVGGQLSSQLTAAGSLLASQIKKKAGDEDDGATDAASEGSS